ncbi:MAG: hypothetical protein LR005_00130 [Candidatus Pacebacteria bacterium]|nr:hypothetical protein [Candidatus Paceibacterota bacterium]
MVFIVLFIKKKNVAIEIAECGSYINVSNGFKTNEPETGTGTTTKKNDDNPRSK